MTTSLVTLAELKEYVSVRSGITSLDAELRDAGKIATKLCEQFTRRKFEEAEYTEYFGTRKSQTVSLDLYGESLTGYTEVNEVQRFQLKNTPISTSASFSVRFDKKRVWGTDSELSTDIYWVDHESGTLNILTYVPRTERTIKVVYTAGYASATAEGETTLSAAAPSDLKTACLITAAALYTKKQRRQWGTEESTDNETGARYSHKGMIPPEAREMLLPYRKTFMGKI